MMFPTKVAAALVEGTFLAAYRFDRYRARPLGRRLLEALGDRRLQPSRRRRSLWEARRHRRGRAKLRGAQWQDTLASSTRPRRLALAERERIQGVEVEVHGREWMVEQGDGRFAAVAQARRGAGG